MNYINGIIPPMVTLLLDEDTLDLDGLDKLINHLIEGGVDGLFILGTTGEGPSLSYSLRNELIKRVCKHVDNRVPVLVGITDSSYRESVNLAIQSQESGAQAVVIAPPYYFNINQSELNNYFNKLIDEISIPVFLYNQPSLTKINIELEYLKELIDRPEVVGFKDSSADVIYFNKVNRLKNRTHFSLLVGPEELLMETIIMGGDGGIPGGANMFPDLYVKLYKAAKNKDVKSALKLHNEIMKISSVIYSGSDYESSNVINGIKYVLHCLGICNDYIAKPLKKISTEKATLIKKFIEKYQVIVDK